jgi:hypothetical protein
MPRLAEAFAFTISLAGGFMPQAGAANCCAVLELRQYILRPGQRDILIELFEREFIESQEAHPMRIAGLFRDLDAPDRLVWLRGFPDMPARAEALEDFYGGPVWQAQRDAANATMIDSSDVLLLRPLETGTGFPDAPLPPVGAEPEPRSVVEARLIYAAAEMPRERIDAAVAALDAALRTAGGTRLAVFVSEHSPNNFPVLPVREGEQVLAWFGALADEAARTRLREALAESPAWREAEAMLAAGAPRPPEARRLEPTARSRLPAVPRDGQHDFDFMIGTWDATLKRLDHPLTGSNRWIELEGVQITRKVWDGRANLDEFYVDGEELRIEGLTLRLYNPKTREWNLYWANARRGLVDPPVVGRWRDGRGEFHGFDTHEGRRILVRYAWSGVTAESAHFEQSFSVDGGMSWEPNWICDIRRRKD